MLWLVSSLLLGCGEEEKTIEFSNLPPFSPIVDLQPSVPYTNDDLEAIIVAPSIDPDDDAVTLTYLWYKDDVLQEDQTGETIAADLTDRGEIWTVAVISNDGFLDSADTRRSVTIRNSLPSIDVVALQWVDVDGTPIAETDPPSVDSLLIDHEDQNIMVSPTAIDGDSSDEITFTYEWEVDGVISALTEDILLYEEMLRGQDWVLRVTANDGLNDSEVYEVSFGFVNEKPVVDSITVTPAEPEVGDDILCEATATDGEEDDITIAYTWTVSIGDGEEAIVSQEEGEILDSSVYASGSSVVCTAIANDGMDDSDPFSSDAIVLTGNSLPVIDSVTITPEEALVGASLTCEAMGTDADGDSLIYSYVWTLDADSSELGTEAILDTSGMTVGDVLVCTAIANDGDVDSASSEASVTLIEESTE